MVRSYPKIVGPPRPGHKMEELARVIGKTISSVEFGEQSTHPKVHKAEAIVLHFTDGTTVSITVGSNVLNLASKMKSFKPTDVSTDIIVIWHKDVP